MPEYESHSSCGVIDSSPSIQKQNITFCSSINNSSLAIIYAQNLFKPFLCCTHCGELFLFCFVCLLLTTFICALFLGGVNVHLYGVYTNMAFNSIMALHGCALMSSCMCETRRSAFPAAVYTNLKRSTHLHNISAHWKFLAVFSFPFWFYSLLSFWFNVQPISQ